MIPIVAIGTSAGGLKEIENFFRNLSKPHDYAFVIIQHLSPNFKSLLVEIVGRFTEMDVVQIENATTVQVGNIYIIPPNKLLVLKNGKLILTEMTSKKRIHHPIDVFFRSMKDTLKEKAIAILLSGTGSDGTLGIKDVKEGGGLTLVQDPTTAEFDGMPVNAIKTGLIDYIVRVEKMPAIISEYIQTELPLSKKHLDDAEEPSRYIDQVFELIQAQTGHDFSAYKRNTINRRIERRLTVNKVHDLASYLVILKEQNEEVVALFKELLIGVTSFFRDDNVFEKLRIEIIPKTLSAFEGKVFRVWVAACSTGEEAYSIAMLLIDHIAKNNLKITIQVFASDIDIDAIESARKGFYTTNIIQDLPQDLLAKFFIEENQGYKVKKALRECVIFAQQNLIKDPPYSKIDLISCRNLLIYLSPELQSRVISIFNYALVNNGVLLLGNSESLATYSSYFQILDRKLKIFEKDKNIGNPNKVWNLSFENYSTKMNLDKKPNDPISKLAREFVLEHYTPPSVVIDYNGNMMYVLGRTGKYLENTTGEISIDILKNARDGLKMHLSNAIRKVKSTNKVVVHPDIRVKTNGEYELVDLILTPLKTHNKDTKLFLVIFKDFGQSKELKNIISPNSSELSAFKNLEKELAEKKIYLQSTIEELESTNEELKSSNEEAQSTNEELQSTNEELETSREELQSVNEELSTTNNELNLKLNELYTSNNNLSNLLDATNIATIFLDRELNIFNFTPAISSITDLLKSDIGRSIKQFSYNLKYDELLNDAKRVLKTLVPFETEVENHNGEDYWMRISPYRTIDDKIEGVVITFTNITEKKKQEIELENYKNHLEELVDIKGKEINKSETKFRKISELSTDYSYSYFFDSNGKLELEWYLGAFERITGYNGAELIKDDYLNHIIHPDDIGLKNERDKKLMNGENVKYEVRIKSKDGKVKWIKDRAYPEWDEKKERIVRIIGTANEITNEKKAEQKIILEKEKAQESDRLKSAFLANMSHEIRTPMNGLVGFADLLKTENLSVEKRNEFIDIIHKSSDQLLSLINDILDISKIESGQLTINMGACNPYDVLNNVAAILNATKKQSNKEHISIIAKSPPKYKSLTIKTDANRIKQVLINLVGNALKFSKKGTITFGFNIKNKTITFFVQDEGIGIPKDKLDKIFNRFEQIDHIDQEQTRGAGLGLSITKGIIELLNGHLSVSSELGKGSRFEFSIPFIESNIQTAEKENELDVDLERMEGKTVLIAEDEPINLKVLEFYLKGLPIKTLYAENGIKAVELFKANRNIDLVLMDIRMPKMSGTKAAEKIIGINPKVKIIAQTAHAMSHDDTKFLDYGFVDYVAKPIKKDILLAKISKWI